MEIKTATIEDIPFLCDLLDLLFTQEAEFAPDRNLQKKGLARIINSDDTGEILVANENGEIVGMVNLLYTVSTALGAPVVLLEDMVVASEKRGQGIGAALLKAAADRAGERGCRRITLLTDDDNEAAQIFYRRHGFHQSPMTAFRKQLK